MIMNRKTMDSLANFCIAQRNAFAAEAWLARAEANREEVGLAATYLSMTSWYGYEEELEEIARRNHFSVESPGLHREAQSIAFDLPYFSAKVRGGIARCQPERNRRLSSR